MKSLSQVCTTSDSPVKFAANYLKYLTTVIEKMNPEPIGQFIEAIENARVNKKQIFFIGNGGSAATASHFANDVTAGPRTWDNPYKAFALTDNVALITAIANDHGYEKIFELQLKAYMNPGDVVVAISASGNSPNVISAIKYANSKNAVTVGMTGFDGGELHKLAKIKVHVPTNKGEYGPVEDLHMIVDHLVGAYLINANKSK